MNVERQKMSVKRERGGGDGGEKKRKSLDFGNETR